LIDELPYPREVRPDHLNHKDEAVR
jgi:hypothetical protein